MQRVLVWAGLLVFLLAACGGGSAPAQTPTTPAAKATTSTTATTASMVRLTFAGSTTVQPLAEKLGNDYRSRNPGVELEIGAGGSRVGIEAIQSGTADIGMASRELKTDEKTPGMEEHQIAIDVLAIIVHPSNPVQDLSLEQLKSIYEGKIVNWNEVGGPDLPIVPVIREVSSGTRGAFDEIVLEGGTPVESAVAQITAGEVHTYIAQTEGAIGYVGFGHLGGTDVKALAINGVLPGPEAALDGSYTLKRPLLLLTGPLSRPEADDFIAFALSDDGQSIVAEDGWVPVKKQP